MDPEAYNLLIRVLEHEIKLEKRKQYPRIVVIDGMPCSGKSALMNALHEDLGCGGSYGYVPSQGAYEQLCRCLKPVSDDAKLWIVCEFHLTAIARAAEGETDLKAEEWAIIDNIVARSEGRIICLVDTPMAIDKRLPSDERNRIIGKSKVPKGSPFVRDWLGRRLQRLNQALRASSVGLKGTYMLRQFLNPENGARTAQYETLLQELHARKE